MGTCTQRALAFLKSPICGNRVSFSGGRVFFNGERERERFVFCSTGGAMAGRGLRWLLRLSNSATISTAGPAGFASRCSSKCVQQEVQLLDVFGAAGFRGRVGSLPLAGQFSHLMTLPNVVSKECTVRRKYYPVCNIGRDLYLEACD